MEITGEYLVDASKEDVWLALNNTDVLQESIPGCKILIRDNDYQFTAKVCVKIGVISATFAGAVSLSNINPPTSYTITGQGHGGLAGFAKGTCNIQLTEAGTNITRLHYIAKAEVGGKLASLGSRLLDGMAKKLSAEFFDAFVLSLARNRMAEKVES